MTETIQEFAELNDYSEEKATEVLQDWADNSKNPGLKAWAQGLLDR